MKENKMFGMISLPMKLKPINNSNGDFVSFESYINVLVKKVNTSIDNKLMQELYNEYKNSDVASLFVISEPEFKKFLLEMLPIYLNNDKPKTKYLSQLIKALETHTQDSQIIRCDYHQKPCVRIEFDYMVAEDTLNELKQIKDVIQNDIQK